MPFFSSSLIVWVVFAAIIILLLRSVVKIVPQNQAFIVERLGRYSRTIEAGIHILVPFLDKVAYQHSLKEYAVEVESQQAITKDNVALGIDGVLYLRVMDPKSGLTV
jgi:regulator of protease activity HflC (stomatin/prohibitin superfamily)